MQQRLIEAFRRYGLPDRMLMAHAARLYAPGRVAAAAGHRTGLATASRPYPAGPFAIPFAWRLPAALSPRRPARLTRSPAREPPTLRIQGVSDAIGERPRAAARPLFPSPRALLAALRPKQWTKNGLIFVALAFTLNLQQPGLVVRSLVAFVCFCALSSAGYLLNDVLDAEADRQHPTKRNRPIASGQVSQQFALTLGVILALGGLAGAFDSTPPWAGLPWRTRS